MGDDDGGGVGTHRFEGGFVEVIEVGVGDEQEVGVDQGFGGDGRGAQAGDAYGFVFEFHPDAIGEDRIDSDGDLVELGNERGVPEPEDGEVVMGQVMEDFGEVDGIALGAGVFEGLVDGFGVSAEPGFDRFDGSAELGC